MGFDKAFETVKAAVQKYGKIRESAVKEVSSSRIAAFHTIGDVLHRFEKTLNYIAEIEKHEEFVKAGKICNSWNYLSNNSISMISRLKPFLSVTYVEGSNKVTFSNKEISVSVNQSRINVLFRGKEFGIQLTLGDIEKNSHLIKALSSKLMLFADSIASRVEQCARLQYGVRT